MIAALSPLHPDFMREQDNYLEHPLAFWNRPDADYLSDDPYQPVHPRISTRPSARTGAEAFSLFTLENALARNNLDIIAALMK